MVTATVFGRTWLKGAARPMVLELPSYKWPSVRNAVFTAKDQGLAFLRTAGGPDAVVRNGVESWPRGAAPSAGPP